MKDYFIELTHSTLGSPLRLNVKSIVMFMRQKDAEQTLMELTIHEQNRALGVEETPEEIIKRINQAQQGE